MIYLNNKPDNIESVYLRNLETLFDLADILEHENNFQRILALISQHAAIYFRSDYAIIMMINPRTHKTIKTIYYEGDKEKKCDNHVLHPIVSGWVIKNNCPFSTENIRTDSRFRKNIFKNTCYRSVLCVPLRSEAIIIGTIFLARESNETYNEDDIDFLNKFATLTSPFIRNIPKIHRYFDHHNSEDILIQKYEKFGLIGRSKKFKEMLSAIEIAAQSDIRVLLEGQSGTGKELIAKAIHKLSKRKDQKFIVSDCGTIPLNLMESELFGHVKGAFTGAVSERKGMIQEADHGTLFLDELSNLPLSLQAKLLRFLQEGEVKPLGSNEIISVDVRIICANSCPLTKLVEQKKFREDLFYRIYVYPIFVPSLNDRKEDIPILANYFVEKFVKQQNTKKKYLHEEIIDFLFLHRWAGNIRELENFIERLVTLAPVDLKTIDREILPVEYKRELKNLKPEIGNLHSESTLAESVARYESNLIRESLLENNWNQSKAARALNISEQTIRYKMQRLGIVNPNN
jgi:transcriptional regulator with GAF, ATPase, and Fis domain